MRDFHRTHSWRLDQGGLFIPHCFDNMGPDSLAWWDDVGFIQNGRRVIVWWQHPRAVYSQKIADQARGEAGEGPSLTRLKFGATKNYRKVGKSGRRKKLVSYTLCPRSAEQLQYDERLRDIEARLTSEGIDIDISASWKWQRLPRAMSVTMVTPIEVRNRQDLASVASMARRLINGQTTLQSEFTAYSYGKADWLRDQVAFTAIKTACGGGVEVSGPRAVVHGRQSQ